MLNVSGHRLGTAEIESALVLHPSCVEAAVVSHASPMPAPYLPRRSPGSPLYLPYSSPVSPLHLPRTSQVGVPHDVKGQGVFAYVILAEGVADTPELIPSLKMSVRTW